MVDGIKVDANTSNTIVNRCLHAIDIYIHYTHNIAEL